MKIMKKIFFLNDNYFRFVIFQEQSHVLLGFNEGRNAMKYSGTHESPQSPFF